MKLYSFFSQLCRCFSHFLQRLLNFVTMRRLLMRAVNRVLLTETFSPVMGCVFLSQVVGLGNPGMEETRHSVGMMVLGELAARLGVADRWRGDKHMSGEVIVSAVQHTRVVLLRPRLLMNVNGVSVAKAAAKYGIKPEDILLVHDELDKPLGKIGIKHGGSARGHNGVRSCVDCLHTDVMLRLRVGIGRPTGKTSVERHVLGRFSSEEKKVLDGVLSQSVDLLLSQLSQQDPRSSSSSSPAGGRQAAGKRKDREDSALTSEERTYGTSN
uniref:peptidyl-tRNA hydrolase n=1 Tax=Echeneis naucrates TaxID=173247 RepID=A0A665TWW8_ECHNA